MPSYVSCSRFMDSSQLQDYARGRGTFTVMRERGQVFYDVMSVNGPLRARSVDPDTGKYNGDPFWLPASHRYAHVELIVKDEIKADTITVDKLCIVEQTAEPLSVSNGVPELEMELAAVRANAADALYRAAGYLTQALGSPSPDELRTWANSCIQLADTLKQGGSA